MALANLRYMNALNNNNNNNNFYSAAAPHQLNAAPAATTMLWLWSDAGVHPSPAEDPVRDEAAAVDRRGVPDAAWKTSRHWMHPRRTGTHALQGTYISRYTPHSAATPRNAKVCRYNWHSAGSLGWPFPMPKYKYIFQIQYTWRHRVYGHDTNAVSWV